ncbi:MAG: DUF3048 domain-containing protein [Clostridiales bacterium]|nr:DUF3048 domain-containing protein [Clostridiales bacterium]
MMKKSLSAVLAALMLLTSLPAMAQTTIDPKEDRNITLQEVGLNEVEEGVSPTTGLTLEYIEVEEGQTGMALTGRYLPMLVQIGNDEGGVGNRAPWGATYADMVYEMPNHQNGPTRLTFLFNDVVPDSVGFVRSARVGHVWLREEWGAGFLFYGQQEHEGSNVLEEFRRLGHSAIGDPLLFSGMVGEGKAWYKYYTERAGLKSPYHIDGNVAGMYSLIPEDYVAPNHAFRFTDATPEGDDALEVTVNWDSDNFKYDSKLVYDIESNTYLRYMIYKNNVLHPWVDKDTEEQIGFANVIVQFTDITYNNSPDAPVVKMVGEGNADFFMAGKHVAGYWKRDDYTSRTVYYDADGNEISLQRGKTLVIVFPNGKRDGRGVSYE